MIHIETGTLTASNAPIHVFIIGCRGIPARYGGYETFAEQLTARKKDPRIQYHVACASTSVRTYEHNGARCFTIPIPSIGPAKAIYYDLQALKTSYEYIVENHIENAIVYVLTYRIGPFINTYKIKLHKLGATLLLNPDGHEWMRRKWSAPTRRYWKYSEKLMVKHSDLSICDSRAIESYILRTYGRYKPKTTFISYGADENIHPCSDEEINEWYALHGLEPDSFFLNVGRFVPENNIETMIRAFMRSNTKRSLALISNVENNRFYRDLLEQTSFDKDPRIRFVGTVYNGPLLHRIRLEAHASFHGHEVGGTNPSLLEALSSTNVNLVLDVPFNREVAQDSALYWLKEESSLSGLIDRVDAMPPEQAAIYGEKAKRRIKSEYHWNDIVATYERLFRSIADKQD